MINRLNPLLHSELRLAIISYLISAQEADFVEIKDFTKATSGNISIQIKKLSEAGYLSVQKGYKNNYPHTSLKITSKGISEFETYIKSLEQYIRK